MTKNRRTKKIRPEKTQPEPTLSFPQLESYETFLFPYLKQGQYLLDYGCGIGAITLELADVIFPGRATGIDPDDVRHAEQLAFGREIVNADFHTANIYHLPFADNTFDIIYSHALFERLEHPINALIELRRVLRTGGILAISCPNEEENPSSKANQFSLTTKKIAPSKNIPSDTFLSSWMKTVDLEILETACWMEKIPAKAHESVTLKRRITPAKTDASSLWSYAVSRKPLLAY